MAACIKGYIKDTIGMKKIIVASNNPVKLKAVQNGFERMFPEERFEILTVKTASGVRDQPMSDSETLTGACTRVENARQQYPLADFWVGLEGGIVDVDDEMTAFAWVALRSGARVGKARTGAFSLPPEIAQLVRMGMELGAADDLVFGRSNSKRENGAVGLLTGNVLQRADLYEHAVILALVRFRNPELYT